MWIMAKNGFISAVQEKGSDEYVVIRARRERDLYDLKDMTKLNRIVATPDADYPYRLTVRKDTFAVYVAKQVLGIKYENFKEAVGLVDRRAASIYEQVWWELLRLENVNERIHPCLRPLEASVGTDSPPSEGGEQRVKRSAGRKRVRKPRRVLARKQDRK